MQEERITAIETELGIVAREALTKLDIKTQDIYEIKERLGTMDTRLGTIDNRLNRMDKQLTTITEETHQTYIKINAITERIDQLETTLNEHTRLLAQILERLPQKMK